MADFYKLDIGDWNVGTDNLTLEQEAAYLRVVNAIRLVEQPIRHNMMVLGGLWRCNDRKAKRLLSELIEAGKLTIEDGWIINRRAVDDASNLRRTKVERRSAGTRGGIESGKSRAKPLKNQDQGDFLLQPEQSRTEQNRTDSPSDSHDFDLFWQTYPHRGGSKRGYAKAKKKWDAAVKLKVDPKRIIDVARQFQSDRKVLEGFSPDPATWLHNAGWDDEIEHVKSSTKPDASTPEARRARLQYLEKVASKMSKVNGSWLIGERFVDDRDLNEIYINGLAPDKLGEPT